MFSKNLTNLIQFPAGKTGNYIIPDSVTWICQNAFEGCSGLMSVTIPASVTRIGGWAFLNCLSLTGFYFEGNAPSVLPNDFSSDINSTVYYLPGTIGWEATYAGRPTASWVLPSPKMLSGTIRAQANSFGFTVSWAANASVVVEAASSPASGAWVPVSTNTLTGGSLQFTDGEWTNYPARFYRVRAQ